MLSRKRARAGVAAPRLAAADPRMRGVRQRFEGNVERCASSRGTMALSSRSEQSLERGARGSNRPQARRKSRGREVTAPRGHEGEIVSGGEAHGRAQRPRLPQARAKGGIGAARSRLTANGCPPANAPDSHTRAYAAPVLGGALLRCGPLRVRSPVYPVPW